MPEWDWVEHSDNKNILIAQKEGNKELYEKMEVYFLNQNI